MSVNHRESPGFLNVSTKSITHRVLSR